MFRVAKVFSVTSAMDYMASLRRVCAQHPGFSRGVLHDYVRPVAAPGGGVALEIECGPNAALMLLARLCRGSSGRCVLYKGSWLTPNEFQLLSGRETAKDWKRSIRHRGRSMKLLLTKGFLTVHETGCECAGCQQV
ncbi:hypothetical protein B566_EDAN007688 [Ephemera danica]|nr:hypothetical protein B566_EDAN007688 [Ephemera danica]